MKTTITNMFAALMVCSSSVLLYSCSNNDDPTSEPEDNKQELKEASLKLVNTNFVEKTVIPTYKGLADAAEKLISAIEAIEGGSDKEVVAAGEVWKSSRQYWEWSEAFLFGAASTYAIDPHIDTWPFDSKSFNTYMSKFHPATNEEDAALIDEAIATGQNLTGFHAIEYLLFREGAARKRAAITDDELYFMHSAANDLYLSACKLEKSWAGNVNKDREALLNEAEFECDNFGEELSNAGVGGSRWKTVTAASIQIIEGCQNIVDEVASAKIGAPYTGEDVNYIESPHAYNSIQDFYDNVMSCQFALYGSLSATNPSTHSVIGYCLSEKELESAAKNVQSAIDNALSKIKQMKSPFVAYHSDPSAGVAIEALEALDKALDTLKKSLED